MPADDPLEPFRFRHRVTVRFRDVDVMGHAHHADALVYFEEARWAYWKEVVGSASTDDIPFVMAEATVRWHRRVTWPAELCVGVRVSRFGGKHFEMEYVAVSESGERMISGRSTQVMYDLRAEVSVPLDGALRAGLEAYERLLEERPSVAAPTDAPVEADAPVQA